jgi:hypothetical protein
MKNLNLVLLLAGALLLGVGLLKPNISNIFPNKSVVIEPANLSEPSANLRAEADNVIQALSADSDRKIDGKNLAQLYIDMATLVSLDGEDQVITNTEEIRQANRLSGLMLHLDIKGKYPELASAAQKLVVKAIGDDQVLLNSDLRAKAVEGFKALAWACNEGSK